MPSLADMEASVPRCDNPVQVGCDQHGSRLYGPCGKPMRWHEEPPRALFKEDPQGGIWVCQKHGPIMDGHEAAARAGYIADRIVEAV